MGLALLFMSEGKSEGHGVHIWKGGASHFQTIIDTNNMHQQIHTPFSFHFLALYLFQPFWALQISLSRSFCSFKTTAEAFASF